MLSKPTMRFYEWEPGMLPAAVRPAPGACNAISVICMSDLSCNGDVVCCQPATELTFLVSVEILTDTTYPLQPTAEPPFKLCYSYEFRKIMRTKKNASSEFAIFISETSLSYQLILINFPAARQRRGAGCSVWLHN